MADERDFRQSGVYQSASAAHSVVGVIRTGKAIAGAASGAAAGPYGLMVTAALNSKNAVRNILIAVGSFLMIPIIIMCMLPSIVFGGLTDAFSSFDPNSPILNSDLAIQAISDFISQSIEEVLKEALENIEDRIEAEYLASGADGLEIKNPFNSDLAYHANLFVAQYCAAASDDFRRMSIEDLADTLRAHLDKLYSYSYVEEERPKTEIDPLTRLEVPVMELDPVTGEPTTIPVMEVWRIYTVAYNGEEYFADHVFQLTDEEKELAAYYAENLSEFLADGMFQYLTDWEEADIPELEDVTSIGSGSTEVVYFNQLDARYKNQPYGTDNIGGYGCGPTSMAIVVSTMTSSYVDPIQMAKWAYENGYWCKGSGSYHSLIPAAARNWGLSVSGCTASEPSRITESLANGKLIVALMRKGHFTSSGHFIVLRGITEDGKILVADPSSYTRSEQQWDLNIFLTEAGHGAGAGGPFWIIG